MHIHLSKSSTVTRKATKNQCFLLAEKGDICINLTVILRLSPKYITLITADKQATYTKAPCNEANTLIHTLKLY